MLRLRKQVRACSGRLRLRRCAALRTALQVCCDCAALHAAADGLLRAGCGAALRAVLRTALRCKCAAPHAASECIFPSQVSPSNFCTACSKAAVPPCKAACVCPPAPGHTQAGFGRFLGNQLKTGIASAPSGESYTDLSDQTRPDRAALPCCRAGTPGARRAALQLLTAVVLEFSPATASRLGLPWDHHERCRASLEGTYLQVGEGISDIFTFCPRNKWVAWTTPACRWGTPEILSQPVEKMSSGNCCRASLDLPTCGKGVSGSAAAFSRGESLLAHRARMRDRGRELPPNPGAKFSLGCRRACSRTPWPQRASRRRRPPRARTKAACA